jgi:hypothetical protein
MANFTLLSTHNTMERQPLKGTGTGKASGTLFSILQQCGPAEHYIS